MVESVPSVMIYPRKYHHRPNAADGLLLSPKSSRRLCRPRKRPASHRALKKLTRVGFEPTPSYDDEKPDNIRQTRGVIPEALESHALDRSAILPTKVHVKRSYRTCRCKNQNLKLWLSINWTALQPPSVLSTYHAYAGLRSLATYENVI